MRTPAGRDRGRTSGPGPCARGVGRCPPGRACAGCIGRSAWDDLASLLGLHAGDSVHALVAVAGPPLLGRANAQDPREVIKTGLQSDPLPALNGAASVAPQMIVPARAETAAAPRCAEQRDAQANGSGSGNSNERGSGNSNERGSGTTDRVAGDRLPLRLPWIDAFRNTCTGARGGHPFLLAGGAPVTTLASSRNLLDAHPALQQRAGTRCRGAAGITTRPPRACVGHESLSTAGSTAAHADAVRHWCVRVLRATRR
ncbi:MAG: hypothetical protein ING59_19380 [Burkholderiales bacterium]|nr:hypothetical protein [Burkholderiales bacterium]